MVMQIKENGFLKKASPKGTERNFMRNFLNVATLDELKKKAILVRNGMETYFPQFACQETLRISNLHLEPKTYAYNNSVVAFVDEEGNFYVIPDIKGTQKLLIENGYHSAYFYVPFSNWDYPVEHKEYWESLWKEKNNAN